MAGPNTDEPISEYAVLDVLGRAFVTDRDGRWRFPTRGQADSLRAVEYTRREGAYLIVEVADDTAPEIEIDGLPYSEGPVADSQTVTAGESE